MGKTFFSLIIPFIFYGCANDLQDEKSVLQVDTQNDNAENYYWYHGNKVFFKADLSQRYALKETRQASRNLSSTCKFNCIYNNDGENSSYKGKNIIWKIEKSNTRSSQDNIIYESPVYMSSKNDTVFTPVRDLYNRKHSTESRGL